MMAKRLEVVAPKKVTDKSGNEKVYWNKIGTVWVDGDKMRLNLDAIPVSGDGCAIISEPKERTDAPGKPQSSTPSGRSSAPESGGFGADFSDAIPFYPRSNTHAKEVPD